MIETLVRWYRQHVEPWNYEPHSTELFWVSVVLLIAALLTIWWKLRPPRIIREWRAARRLKWERSMVMRRERKDYTDKEVANMITEGFERLVAERKLTAKEVWEYSHDLGHRMRNLEITPGNNKNKQARTKGIIKYQRAKREQGDTVVPAIPGDKPPRIHRTVTSAVRDIVGDLRASRRRTA